MAALSPNFDPQFFDGGAPASGYLLHTYATGTTTPLGTFQDQGATIPNTNPIVLDAAGRAKLWLSPSAEYRLELKTPLGATVSGYPIDDVAGVSTAIDDAAIRADLESTASGKGAAMVGFIESATSAVARTMLEKSREIAISVLDFGCVGDGSTDDSAGFALALAALGPGVRLSMRGLTIKISQQNVISSKSGFVIDGEGATVIAANGMTVASNKELLSFRNCTDFTVKNLNVDGNRANRTPAETPAHNIELRSCQRFLIERVRANNAVCDGFILNTATNTDSATYCKDFVIFECFADNAYRQGMSIINAWDGLVIGGAYTNTNGTLPQAGIDVESNTGAATPGSARMRFDGVRFDGNAGRGLLMSGVSGSQEHFVERCTFVNNGLGGIDANTNATTIRSNIFRSHGTSAVNGIITFSAAAAGNDINAGLCEGNTFTGNTSTVYCMHNHSTANRIRFEKNIVLDHAAGGGITLSGKDSIARGNVIVSCGGVGINAVATDPLIEQNTISAATGRAILSVGSIRPMIVRNTCRDVASVSGAYIQCDDAQSVIDANNCIASSAQATTLGIRVSNVTAKSVNYNVCVNLHTTDPYAFTGVGTSLQFVGNIGGTANTGAVAKRQVPPSGTTGGRPAGATLTQYQPYWDTTIAKPVWWDGTVWKDATGATV